MLTTGYTNPTRKVLYIKYAFICVRSAMVPATIEDNAQAKVHWKKNFSKSIPENDVKKNPALPINVFSVLMVSPP